MLEISTLLVSGGRGLVEVEPVKVLQETTPVKVDLLFCGAQLVDNERFLWYKSFRLLPKKATKDCTHIINNGVDPNLEQLESA